MQMYTELVFLSLLLTVFTSLFEGCRNVEAGERAVKSTRSCGITSGEVSCFQLDVGSFKSIKTFAGLVLKSFPRVDLLVNNGMYVLTFFFSSF